jgi:hypothetical protein
MAKYANEWNRTASASLSVGGAVADPTTPRRLEWTDLIVGSEATPADGVFLWQLQRCTSNGVGTAITPNALDPADAAALYDTSENYTGDPPLTAGAIQLSIALNQRATFRWVSAPDAPIVTPATALNGIMLRTPTAALVAVTGTAHINER